jgi:hypothetical protein
MTNKRVIPEFATEAEEAEWWFEHRDELSDDFVAAAKDGTLGRGRLASRFGLTTNLVAINQADAAIARERAAQSGMEYQAYVQRLVHQALERERKAS